MTRNRISVVTPLHAPSVRYLLDAYESLRAQEMPDDWEWEWAIQCDGHQDVPELIRGDPRCSTAVNRPSGPGPTRNMALARTAGSLIRNLDADDQLTAGALARDITAYLQHPDIGWTTATAFDLHDDGSVTRWANSDPTPGLVPVGWVLAAWQGLGWSYLPTLPTSLSIKRDLLVQLGGWMALPTSEDTGLLVAASAIAAGYLHDEPGVIYRKHSEQVTATAEHQDQHAAEQRRSLIVERARALTQHVTAGELPIG
ncbi:MAG: hypothetical protein ACRCYU_03120 [Nocardioides sp.]